MEPKTDLRKGRRGRPHWQLWGRGEYTADNANRRKALDVVIWIGVFTLGALCWIALGWCLITHHRGATRTMEHEIPVPSGLDATAARDELPGLESQSAEAEAEGTPPKKRRKRGPNKPKAAPAATGPVTDPATEAQNLANLSRALGVGFQMSGKVLAAMRGDHWNISEQESQALGDAWAVALAPYMPRIAPYLPFATAAIVTVGVFAPKVQRDREIRARIPRALPVTDTPQPARTGIAAAPAETASPDVSPVAPGAAGEGAPHLAYDGGFPPPGAVEGTNAAPKSRRRPAAPAATET